ncbi:MAG: hypothetical protein JWR80_492 [Bradyrhizobium sp.]|nr:hypothetical protein [Bradyrhizobium sp.]
MAGHRTVKEAQEQRRTDLLAKRGKRKEAVELARRRAISELLEEAENWKRANANREYVNAALEQADAVSRVEWASWARGIANSIDPLASADSSGPAKVS